MYELRFFTRKYTPYRTGSTRQKNLELDFRSYIPVRGTRKVCSILTQCCFVGVDAWMYIWILDDPLQTDRHVEYEEEQTSVWHVGGVGGVEYQLTAKVPEMNLNQLIYTDYRLRMLL